MLFAKQSRPDWYCFVTFVTLNNRNLFAILGFHPDSYAIKTKQNTLTKRKRNEEKTNQGNGRKDWSPCVVGLGVDITPTKRASSTGRPIDHRKYDIGYFVEHRVDDMK